MVESGTNQQIGYILRSFPRLSQTFILNEILALEQAGVKIQVFALSDPQEEIVQPQVQQLRAPVHYLSRGATDDSGNHVRHHPGWLQHLKVFCGHPIGYLRALLYALRKREIDQGYTSSSRRQCFSMAVTLVSIVDRSGRRSSSGIAHLHAHFAHDPTLIAHLVHLINGITYSFTAHARDLFQVPVTALEDRIRRASAVVTCCQNNLAYLEQVAPSERSKFSMIYHGVNIQHFRPPATGRENSGSPLILSVGRLVEKKGYLNLIAALALVKQKGFGFQCAIYGDGPLEQKIAQSIEAFGLNGWVWLAGKADQSQLIEFFQSAAMFALTPTVTEDGDRDGIPNVLVEAMAVGLPVVSTKTAGIPELITHDQNGLLYSPTDVDGIAAGIIELLQDTAKRDRLGKAARATVIEQFDSRQSAGQLKDLFARHLLAAEYRELAMPGWFGFRG